MTFKSQKVLSWLLLSTLGIIWGSSFFAIKIALISFQPVHLASLRIIIGALILLIFSLLLRKNLFSGKKPMTYWLACLGVALLSNTLPFILLAVAQEHLSSVFVGLCMATIPLIILLLAHFLLSNEQISIKKMFGIILGVCGTGLLISSQSGMIENPSSLTKTFYIWLCILAPFCYASGAIIIRKLGPTDFLEFSTHSLLIACLICMPVLIFFGDSPLNVNYQAISAILYLGIFPTGIATIILVSIIKNEGAVFVSLVNFKVPFWSTVFGVFFLNEVLPNNFSASFSLILTGILICQLEKAK